MMLMAYCTGIEARGFIFGPPIALALGAKFVPMRKPNKLPGKSFSLKLLVCSRFLNGFLGRSGSSITLCLSLHAYDILALSFLFMNAYFVCHNFSLKWFKTTYSDACGYVRA